MSLRDAAYDILQNLGGTVRLFPKVGETFDFALGLPVDSGHGGVLVNASPPLPMSEEFLRTREGVTGTDKVFYFDTVTTDGAGIVPEVLGSIEHAGVRMNIVSVETMYERDTIVAYVAVARA